MDKSGFAFERKERELKCDLTEEEWGCAALQEHGGAKGEAEERSETVERLVDFTLSTRLCSAQEG